MHVVASPPRQDTTAQRKRPKYTRSKTGCLTCRAKKIKCDESKPNCMRCTHGQRECTWPEGVPPRKKTVPKHEPAPEPSLDTGLDTRPSTAGSSGMSETSTPPTRDNTPPGREPMELGLPPIMSRRHTEPVLHVPGVESGTSRRQSLVPMSSTTAQGYAMHPTSSQILPAIPESESSYSAHQYPHSYSNGHQHYTHPQSLVLPRVTSYHEHAHSMRADAFSSTGQWSTTPLLPSVDPIEPFFPTVQERNLIHHYCDNAKSIIMALPSENPILAANLQFVLSRPRGSDSAVESLRMALLGVAAVHQSFLLSQNGACHGGADQVMRLANSFRNQSKQLLVQACTTSEGVRNDAALGAAVALALVDIFSGGQNWFKTLRLAKMLINMRGGPAVLLARSSHPEPGSVTGVSRARLLLEIVAVYELFGCLVNGEEPTLLSPNASNWWLDKANSDDSQSYVEYVFGMSREFIPVLARITSFFVRALANQSCIREVSADATTLSDTEDANEARTLYNLLDKWTHRREDLPDRVRAGNRIYQNAAQIALLRDILKVPPDDALVQQHCSDVLSLCLDCGQNQMGVDLTWPVIIAGSQMYGADRTRVLAIFQVFRYVIMSHRCYEIETAEHIVFQVVWKRLDEKLPRADWRSVLQDQNLNVLIL
ncbi:fungal-specific transcription factor domain-containing protein [Sparassis latifolia]